MASVTHKGDWRKTTQFLEHAQKPSLSSTLVSLAQKGLDNLKEATPVRTGITANSWECEITNESGLTVNWNNTHIENGWANVAILLNDGHGTRNGGYVPPLNYIDPAIQPVMDEMVDAMWKEVSGDVG